MDDDEDTAAAEVRGLRSDQQYARGRAWIAVIVVAVIAFVIYSQRQADNSADELTECLRSRVQVEQC